MVMSEVVAVTRRPAGAGSCRYGDDLRGIITDGDPPRRTLVEGRDLSSLTAEQVMDPTPQDDFS